MQKNHKLHSLSLCGGSRDRGVRATPSVLIVPLERNFIRRGAAISFAVGVNLLP
jgi:hypothetical protein